MAFLALPWFVVQGLLTTVSGLPFKGLFKASDSVRGLVDSLNRVMKKIMIEFLISHRCTDVHLSILVISFLYELVL